MNLNFSKLEGFEWDLGNLDHIKKHNVSDSECEQAFLYWDAKLFKDNKHSIYEERFKIFGKTFEGRPLSLAFTIRKNRIRVIMARDQNKKERGELNE